MNKLFPNGTMNQMYKKLKRFSLVYIKKMKEFKVYFKEDHLLMLVCQL